jgi:hypothetical protein
LTVSYFINVKLISNILGALEIITHTEHKPLIIWNARSFIPAFSEYAEIIESQLLYSRLSAGNGGFIKPSRERIIKIAFTIEV